MGHRLHGAIFVDIYSGIIGLQRYANYTEKNAVHIDVENIKQEVTIIPLSMIFTEILLV